jgi:phage host-nuclease inhibitor protein Gam
MTEQDLYRELAPQEIDDAVETETELPAEERRFFIRDEHMAEWAVRKIAQERRELKRVQDMCQAETRRYEEFRLQAEADQQRRESYLTALLDDYMRSVPTKQTKTQETVSLPSGRLVRKFPSPDYRRDDKELVKWLEDMGKADMVRVKKEADWAALKTQVTISGNDVVYDETGEIVPGVKVAMKPARFAVETREEA